MNKAGQVNIGFVNDNGKEWVLQLSMSFPPCAVILSKLSLIVNNCSAVGRLDTVELPDMKAKIDDKDYNPYEHRQVKRPTTWVRVFVRCNMLHATSNMSHVTLYEFEFIWIVKCITNKGACFESDWYNFLSTWIAILIRLSTYSKGDYFQIELILNVHSWRTI